MWWLQYEYIKISKYSTAIIQLIKSSNLQMSVKEVARPKSGICLDNVVHNIRSAKTNLLEFVLSDHTGQLMAYPVKQTCTYNYWFCMKTN